MSKDNLAEVPCECCGGTAFIRKRSNGKGLLYKYCPIGGMDQRSGKLIQAKWQAAIDAKNNGGSHEVVSEQKQVNTAIQTNDEWTPDYLKVKAESANHGTAEQPNTAERNRDNNDHSRAGQNTDSASGTGGITAGQIITGLAVLGLAAIGIKSRLHAA